MKAMIKYNAPRIKQGIFEAVKLSKTLMGYASLFGWLSAFYKDPNIRGQIDYDAAQIETIKFLQLVGNQL